MKIEVSWSNSQTHSSSLFRLHFVPILQLLYVVVYVDTVRFPQQHFVKIQLCKKKRVNLWSSSLYGRFHFHNCEKYYPNTMNNSPCGGFQSKWNVLPEHVEFASLGFIQLKLTLNLNKTIYLPHVLFWDSWCYKKVKIKVGIFKILKLIWFVESEKNTTY